MNRDLIYYAVIKKLNENIQEKLDSKVLNLASEMIKRVRSETINQIIEDYAEKEKIQDYQSYDVKLNACIDFINSNLYEFYDILKSQSSFKHLGSGTYGDAYDLGDKVLKIEIILPSKAFSSQKRAKKNLQQLWKGTTLAKNVPMIYATGELYYVKHTYSWAIMEKFETLDTSSLDDILNPITHYLNRKTPEEIFDICNKSPFLKEISKQIQRDLMLKDNWLIDLITAMKQLKKIGLADFHSGNVGIRRSGGQGTLIFFD